MRKYIIFATISPFIILLAGAIRLPGPPVWYPQIVALLFIFFLGTIIFLWDFNKHLARFVGWILLSTMLISRFSPRSLFLMFYLIFGCLSVYGISKIKGNGRRIILRGLFILVLLQFVFSVSQSFGFDPIFMSLINPGKEEIVGFSGAKDQLGSFFALTAPLLVYFNPFFSIITAIGLAFSKSSFAFISGLMSILLYLKLTNKRLFLIGTAICIILSGIFFFNVDKLRPADFSTRLNVWKHVIDSSTSGKIVIQQGDKLLQVNTNSVFGYGFGSFLQIFPFVPQGDNGFNFIDEKFTHAHNDYIEILLFELGYIGVILFILLFMNFIKDFIKSKKNKELIMYFCCIVAYLLNAMGNFISQLAVSGMFLIMFYGLYEGTRRELNG